MLDRPGEPGPRARERCPWTPRRRSPASLRYSPKRPAPPSPNRGWSALWAIGLVVLTSLAIQRPLLRWFYPLRYQQALCRWASRAQLPPSLVAAVVLHESRFAPQARSSAGALGLMQILPETAEWVTRKPVQEAQLLEPSHNLEVGTAYLGHLCRRFGGDRVAALAAYNAGPERVRAWYRRGQPLDASRIPFPETRCYVRNVLCSQTRYQALYPELDRGL